MLPFCSNDDCDHRDQIHNSGVRPDQSVQHVSEVPLILSSRTDDAESETFLWADYSAAQFGLRRLEKTARLYNSSGHVNVHKKSLCSKLGYSRGRLCHTEVNNSACDIKTDSQVQACSKVRPNLSPNKSAEMAHYSTTVLLQEDLLRRAGSRPVALDEADWSTNEIWYWLISTRQIKAGDSSVWL